MEFNFSLQRLLWLVAFLVLFAVLGGFVPPSLSPDSMLDPRRVTKAWSCCVLLFIAGAVCVSVMDHFVGTLDRSNLRLLYILIGLVLMIGSYMWIRGLHGAAKGEPAEVNKTSLLTPGSSPVPAVMTAPTSIHSRSFALAQA